jgi:signal transduction histidine kinase
MELAERSGRILEIKPLSSLATAAAGLGHVHIEIDRDGVARQVFLKEGVGEPHWKHFSLVVHEFIQGKKLDKIPGVKAGARITEASKFLNVRNHLNLIPYINNSTPIQTISYADLISGIILDSELKDKIIFVGATAAGMGDQITTPIGQISGVEINAHIYHALRSGTLISPVSSVLYSIFCAVIIGGFLWLGTRFPPLYFLLSMIFLGLGTLILSFMAINIFRIWLPPTPVIVSVLVAYPMWNWWRLENVVGYLRQELASTQENITFNTSGRNKSDIVKNMCFLKDLGAITGWVLFDSVGRKLHSDGPIGLSSGIYKFSRDWHHKNFLSSKLIQSPKGYFKLAVMWNENNYIGRDKMSIFIPDDLCVEDTYPIHEDQIAQTIWQLSRTNLVVEANRKIIDESLEQLSVGVILARFDGMALLINHQARVLLNVDTSKPSLFDLLSHINLTDTHSWKVLINDLVFFEESFTVQGDTVASGRTILCRGRVIHADAPLFLINITDITELKKSERDRMEALNFLSHDMRSPMTSVLALIEGERIENSESTKNVLLQNIERYIYRNLSYSENFIQLAKLDNTQELDVERCDVHSLIYNAVIEIYPSAKLRNIKINYPDTKPELWILCDRNLIERALVNILDNAVKYSCESTQVFIDTSCFENTVEISIADEGDGIPENDLSVLFDSFQQGRNVPTGIRSGAGLGLRFVAAVCEKHNGQVLVKNNSDKGAQFTLCLPLADRC